MWKLYKVVYKINIDGIIKKIFVSFARVEFKQEEQKTSLEHLLSAVEIKKTI